MKKRRISYRDWLNRGPLAPATSGDPGVSEQEPPTADHTDAAVESGVAGEHEVGQGPPTAEYAAHADAADAAADSERPTANGELPTTEGERQTADSELPTADRELSTVEGELPTASPGPESSTPVQVEYLVFRVGPELFALPLETVDEALDIEQIQPLPEMHASMLGVITLRGATVPVYAPEVPLGVAGESHRAVLLFTQPRGAVALAVDDVDDVLVIAKDDVQRPPLDFGDGVLVGVAHRNAELIGVLDAGALLAACRVEPVLETA